MNKCNECGLCKEVCPAFKILRRESVSPRGYAIMQKKEVYDRVFYFCVLCGNCERVCPYGIKLKLQEFRERHIEEGVDTQANKEMIANLKKNGVPFDV
tara:strand:+ start:207 stop:500 length:294 start_codon:yes stop_codon:yes gene_type:complete